MSEKYAEHLIQEYVETERYGQLYGELKKSTYVSEKDAVQVVRLLDKGKVDEAEDQIKGLLE